MKIKACSRCGSRKLALMELPKEKESYPHSELMDNLVAVRYLCGDCALIDEAVVFNSEEDWRRFLDVKNQSRI
ncbi:MAG: hypothetical protein B6U72_04040 [Candidatus Altiarchaeales archaeon ex4484_2]|nr:MAG: hypothetical protein B6U72_04040 [Candidatus Altiarchaeales archaeon ex4484_2]